MKRIAVIITGFALLFPAAALAGSGGAQDDDLQPSLETLQNPVHLNRHVVISSDMIQLGDIFQNAGKYNTRAVAYAPRPGQRAVFDARWLAQIAKAFRLEWRPTSGLDQTVVEREANIIDAEAIQAMVFDRLIDEGVDPSSQIILANRNQRLYVPVGENIEFNMETMTFDAISGRFATYLVWNNANRQEKVRITGRVEQVSEIPVVQRRILRGDTIRSRDIKWVRVLASKMQRDWIMEPSDLIGMTATRTLSAGKPVRTAEIRRPLLVKKGSIVIMQLTTPLMSLTAQGRALQEGSRGDIIRISNMQTNTVIEAQITGPGTARVETPINLAMK